MNEFQHTLVLIKPDAVARGLVGEIIGRIERKGLLIGYMSMMNAGVTLLRDHYANLNGKPYFGAVVESMQAGPLVVLCVCGLNAVAVMRSLIGVTAGYEAQAGTIRGDFSNSQRMNLIHASDSVESAERELSLWLTDYQLVGASQRTLERSKWAYSTDEQRYLGTPWPF